MPDFHDTHRPRVSSQLLLALVALAVTTAPAHGLPGASEPSCDAGDHTGGLGGQDVSCPFTCDADQHVELEVVATDKDAAVSGTARCGGVTASCSGQKTCDDKDGLTTAGAGSCEGHSSEVYDSGLHVYCEATSDPIDKGPVPRDWCILTQPVPVCTGGLVTCPDHILCHPPSECSLSVVVCELVRQVTDYEAPDTGAPADPTDNVVPDLPVAFTAALNLPMLRPGVHIFMSNGSAEGWICSTQTCTPSPPICEVSSTGVTCIVGFIR